MPRRAHIAARDGRSFLSMRRQAWTCLWLQRGVHTLELENPGGSVWGCRDTLLEVEMAGTALICIRQEEKGLEPWASLMLRMEGEYVWLIIVCVLFSV